MRYLSVCSGIEAATAAWHGLGWTPVAFSEIDKFPAAVLAHHYPNVPNRGDMTKFKEWPNEQFDVLVGGTPCQSFSVAGLRKGLADPRGNLALTYCAIADKYRPRWLVWENVPGILSIDGGRAFGSLLRAMAELGYGFAYRVLDAQYVRTRRFARAIPQRRRRVFVVAHLGDWRAAAAVLFDAESLRGNPPPGREAGQAAPIIPSRSAAGCDGGAIAAHETGQGWWKQADHAGALRAEGENRPSRPSHVVAHALRGEGINTTCDEGQTQVPVAFDLNQITSKTNRSQPDPAVHHTLPATTCPPHLASPMAVRRLTPVECERLQGFPDNFTRIPWRGKPADQCPDGPRYKALGNSMAVNAMEWLGERINLVESVT